METPIFDMIFKRPFPRALTRFSVAFFAVTSSSTPRRTMSATVCRARYGFTAAAPKPISKAM